MSSPPPAALATAPVHSSARPLPRRLVRLLAGLALYGAALGLMARAAVGVDPWTVLAQGVGRQTGAGLGWVTIAVGALVLLLWWPLRVRPGVGTVLNVVVVGAVLQLVVDVLPAASTLLVRVPQFALGLVLLALATAVYLGAGLGSGPRDGLMTGLRRVTGWPVGAVRGGIEVTVLALGWVLGGDVGPGTVAFALGIGPLCAFFLRLLAPDAVPARRR